ncbi:lachesin-like [Pholidichthys leucotaenia]
MSFTAAATGLIVVLLSVSVVQSNSGWWVTYKSHQICAVRGATVELQCDYGHPKTTRGKIIIIEKKFWFTKIEIEPEDLTTESGYADRVEHRCDLMTCTLRITDVKESDSAMYNFRFIANPPSASYMKTSGVRLSVGDGPNLPSVSVSPSGEIVEGRSVTLNCSSDANPPAKYTWYKENQTIIQGQEGLYYFSPIRKEDSGSYYCKSENKHGDINSTSVLIDVQYGPNLPSVSASPSGEIVEGHSVTLNCSSDANPPAKYTWYKENQTIIQGQEGLYYFSPIRKEDSGSYYCKSENKHGDIKSTSVLIDVQYPPEIPSVARSPSGEIVKGSSVTLTCSSDANPASTYSWYEEANESPKSSGENFMFTDIRSEHSGKYYCKAQNRWGSQVSSLHVIDVPDYLNSAAVGSITVIFLAFIVFSAFLLIRRRRSLKQREQQDNTVQQNMGPKNASPLMAAQRKPEDREDICYSTVAFSKMEEDPLYCNITLTMANKQKHEEEKEAVDYSEVRYGGRASGLRCDQEAAEDSLYSTICKIPRV